MYLNDPCFLGVAISAPRIFFDFIISTGGIAKHLDTIWHKLRDIY